MWLRVELNKDGSILNSKIVESSGEGGRLVRYIECSGEVEGLNLVRAWWKRRALEKRKREKRRAEARCVVCGRPAVDASCCEACRKSARERQAYYRERGIKPPVRPKTSSDSERAEMSRRARQRDLDSRSANMKLTGSANPKKAVRLKLRETLVQFDNQSPTMFRAWLVAEIARFAPLPTGPRRSPISDSKNSTLAL